MLIATRAVDGFWHVSLKRIKEIFTDVLTKGRRQKSDAGCVLLVTALLEHNKKDFLYGRYLQMRSYFERNDSE
jgi:hypothetical protein